VSLADTLADRYDAALAQRGVALRDEFTESARELEEILDPVDLERWAERGADLATQSLRSWEAASEYFHVSPDVARTIPFDLVMRWAGVAERLSEASPLIAAAYMRATPGALSALPPDPDFDIGIQGEHFAEQTIARTDLDRWAEAGERLHHGNWKSIALTVLFFDLSPELLASLSMDQLDELVDVLTVLAERSYQLATTCLESAPPLFAALDFQDRQPFLQFAGALSKASWADTRLYFERGPDLVRNIEEEQRAPFLTLAARVVQNAGRQGFPHFMETANALGTVPQTDHATLLGLAGHLARRSPVAAMGFLRSAPTVLSRINGEQLAQWVEPGSRLLFDEGNIEGADAYFRLQSARAEQVLASLSARVELSTIHGLLRMYAKALTGASVSIRSSEDLVDKGIGWVTESMATTEGSAIFLPPFVGAFPEQRSNFQSYKVFTTHQTGRIEFGSFAYHFGEPGAYAPASTSEREAGRPERTREALTGMERFYDLFPERLLISSLFTIAEDTRVDALVGREYGGIRAWLKRVQSLEADRRPDVREQGLRNAYVENLLRASLGRPDTIRWPRELMPTLETSLAALRVVEEPGATVEDAAEVAAALYDIAVVLPNRKHEIPEDEWEEPPSDLGKQPQMPGGMGQAERQMPPGDEPFEPPQQPEFRGDFKPELVQLLSRLKEQQSGESGDGQSMSREQIMDMLEKSAEIAAADLAEGEVAASMGQFLTNLEKEAQAAAAKAKQKQQGGEEEGGGDGEDESADLPNEITWSYYPEWDFRASDYRPRWCRVGERIGDEGGLDYYDDTLQRHHGLVVETRRQFELMRPESFRRIKKLEDGEEIDLDRALEFIVDRRAGVGPLAQVYWRRNKVERDVAVAFLMDMSASTDEEVEKPRVQERPDGNFTGDPRNYFQWLAERRSRMIADAPKRIVDLEKESLVLIVEALEAIGDSYGIYGFSGYGRDNVEFHVIKDLAEKSSDKVRRRIDKIQPIRSTRMGPAIRHTIAKMDDYDAKVKILILVSDGRPQDHGYGRDRTEKEYAVHDTHQALLEAKRAGIVPFLITVDKEGHDYLGQMCSDVGYEVVDDIEQLPRRLTSLYRVLAAD
jgi:hypothetical protein